MSGGWSLFDGPGLDALIDDPRLKKQIGRVYTLMADGAWRMLSTIAHTTGAPEASVSARLRDLRKSQWGGHEVQERRVEHHQGTHIYRLVPSERGLLDGRGGKAKRPPRISPEMQAVLDAAEWVTTVHARKVADDHHCACRVCTAVRAWKP